MDEKPARMHYFVPILVDVERLEGLYAASLAGRPDVMGQGDNLLEALGELGVAVIYELGAEA